MKHQGGVIEVSAKAFLAKRVIKNCFITHSICTSSHTLTKVISQTMIDDKLVYYFCCSLSCCYYLLTL